jgi:hypothetical protein
VDHLVSNLERRGMQARVHTEAGADSAAPWLIEQVLEREEQVQDTSNPQVRAGNWARLSGEFALVF